MSPIALKPYHPEKEGPPKKFDIEQHQIDVFRAGGWRDALWEFLERLEKEAHDGNNS